MLQKVVLNSYCITIVLFYILYSIVYHRHHDFLNIDCTLLSTMMIIMASQLLTRRVLSVAYYLIYMCHIDSRRRVLQSIVAFDTLKNCVTNYRTRSSRILNGRVSFQPEIHVNRGLRSNRLYYKQTNIFVSGVLRTFLKFSALKYPLLESL